MTKPPTVFVVDDDQAMRNSLKWLIESVSMQVETFESADAFIKSYYPGRSGCLLLDVRMPGMSGLELQEYLRANQIAIPVIIITGHGDVPMAVRAMKSGAVDFIEKPFNDELLLESIRYALALDVKQRDMQKQRAEIATRLARLTPREHEVMVMVTNGKANKEIASSLGVSAKTVEAHRARVMEKMQANSLAELVRMAISANLTLSESKSEE
ncbi:MAG: response regulator transcription factor [Candidatus Thiodiazotropha sp. (ex Lucina aurantia)]|uniref:Transcriptional regulatory protein TdiR n=2 Tax=Candidatus Thiodiazotropha TaxID=1913444 RepID=A0A7Z0VJY1_9GAMM|nr:response regulator transcription factor [Candidatus Thiodiazotropha endolucinida]MBT3012835.1 response regulator transcription factor [Candidatus Thiodiazotropha sp. (ex Lucina pensylvanica)]MBT3015770.1 response regulator transcription factor [Candidatus Thiodiazotropha taylori]MBT3038582.1 response regulator transcription factor [Candidatus Thiodiazotropha sp. (ex Codakia orbicularis)]MBV2104268.1 response regulator transcription factor [Candidatus Thiodiazotropha sp. (ex Lucina aurantia)]